MVHFSSEREVYPRFVVQFHNDNYILDERVKQPHDIKIFASQMFIFKTPVQNEDHIREIYLSGGKIFLEAFRPKDRASSLVKHEFEFKVHNGSWRNSNIEWSSGAPSASRTRTRSDRTWRSHSNIDFRQQVRLH